MTLGNWVILGWFVGVPGILLTLWLARFGPAAEWGWDIVLAPWWIGAVFILIGGVTGAFGDRSED